MTPQQRKEAARYLKAFDFSGLFGDPSIGWDWPETGKPLRVPVPWRGKDEFHTLETVAEKRGVRVFHVPPLPDGGIMPSDERKKLEKAVTPLATEHLLIFTDAAKTRQIWLWTSRLPGKPVRHRELTWEKGRENELLLQKLTSIAFTLDEEEALDITGVVQRLRDNLDRDRLTKRFYDDFRKHKDAFQKFIKGISDEGIMAHYTSLMLNRLMFCYFLQQKGFLDGDQHYLRNRFETVRDTLGRNRFHSFYRSFLRRLFHDGLDAQSRPDELTAIIGKNIPYLNGGIFAEHPIERAHPDITIPDEAFGKIFDFFDEWNWHLDGRPLAVGNEINPEVLGYVFEKYTNQKEMGAYYTKEDITEYISKNTILPFLLQKIAAKLPSGSWDLLKNDPDRYIYEPVRRGAGKDEKEWKKSLPENIAIGLGSVGVSPAFSSSKECGQDGHAPAWAAAARRRTMSDPSPFLIYRSEDGRTKLDVRLDDQTVWLSQKQLTELFGKAKGTISEHIKHIFEDGELTEDSVVRLFRTTAADGKTYEVAHYNLDMVLALGFRVRSHTAMRFRQWAADKLKEFILKGFVLDDDRLKNPDAGNDYFEELTRRIQDIRTSERRFYQKITDIYATSIDYDKDDALTQSFFATVQNKVHFAIHGQTAEEVIISRADSARPNMGLTNWEGARIRKTDVAISKNYLNEQELRALNNLVEQYLIFAQSQAERRVPMAMRDWITKLEGFLTLNDREILTHAGKISAEAAKSHAEAEFLGFRKQEDHLMESDFDRAVKQLPPAPRSP